MNDKIDAIYKSKGTQRPSYQGEIPQGNDKLGLMLLGITGDQVDHKMSIKKLRQKL